MGVIDGLHCQKFVLICAVHSVAMRETFVALDDVMSRFDGSCIVYVLTTAGWTSRELPCTSSSGRLYDCVYSMATDWLVLHSGTW